jgi:ubiquinone/menaquinone biosynthesis C-methylase UbiE
MLHVAPEKCFEPRLKKQLKQGYITADLLDPKVMVKMDVTNIKYPDASFDVIYCSHVLLCVKDDKKALREFYRTLKQEGWAVLLEPVHNGNTIEGPSQIGLLGHFEKFGELYQIRRYGRDFIDRLREAGFTVKVIRADDMFNKEDIALMGLTPFSGNIYYCSKSKI